MVNSKRESRVMEEDPTIASGGSPHFAKHRGRNSTNPIDPTRMHNLETDNSHKQQ
ncbi:hypothetical protein HanIR_Chr14g0724291 [Helianthus annuus]|nr:hypothetical protein HanIR_Chr14g0724291 [Helianthus annuus]